MNTRQELSTIDLKKDLQELENRFLVVLDLITPARGGYEFLHSKTGISYERWRNVSTNRQSPSTELVLGLCRLKPEWALWLLTGEHDDHPQQAPSASDLERAMEARLNWSSRTKKRGQAARKLPQPQPDGWSAIGPETSQPAKGEEDDGEPKVHAIW